METVALVVPRFGEEVVGGSERLFLNYARLLSKKYKVEVITSAAQEYTTWMNQYPLGKTEFEDNITIYRFPSECRWRSINTPDFWGQYGVPHPGADMLQLHYNKDVISAIRNIPRYNAEKFIIEQGPYSKEMFQFMTWNHNKWKKVLFTPYLYPTTYLGIDRIPNNKVLILMAAHHEPHIYFPCFRKYASYRWLVYFDQEAKMLNDALGTHNSNYRTVKPSVGEVTPEKDIEIDENKVVFLGRASGGKGFNFVAKLVDKYRLKYPNINIKLHVVGDIGDDVKELIHGWRDWIVVHGSVSTKKRDYILQTSLALINASVLDSFGLVNLEAARLGVPVFLNQDCPAFRSLAAMCKGGFIPFRTNDADNGFINGLHKLRNKEYRQKCSAFLIEWGYREMGEDKALQRLVQLIEE